MIHIFKIGISKWQYLVVGRCPSQRYNTTVYRSASSNYVAPTPLSELVEKAKAYDPR